MMTRTFSLSSQLGSTLVKYRQTKFKGLLATKRVLDWIWLCIWTLSYFTPLTVLDPSGSIHVHCAWIQMFMKQGQSSFLLLDDLGHHATFWGPPAWILEKVLINGIWLHLVNRFNVKHPWSGLIYQIVTNISWLLGDLNFLLFHMTEPYQALQCI